VSWVEAGRFAAGTAYAAFDRHTFGDLAPWVYKTTDYGASWTRIVSPEQGVRGYAHVIKQDPRKPGLLYLGTEFGLFISLDDGASWAQFQGGDFPNVAVRDLQFQEREDDLVIATHGRGLWVIDDLAPLRALSSEVLQRPATFLPSRPLQQRMPATGGWPEGDAAYRGTNPANGAVISYFLGSRHVYGPIQLQVFDAAGKLVDSITPGKRRGINRVVWNMRVKPPRVPRAAQISFGASLGGRVPPGQYTARLSRGADVIETKLRIEIDRRAPYTVADRKAHFAAMQRADALFGQMTELAERIDRARSAVEERLRAPGALDLAAPLRAAAERLEQLKKRIVATTEGGAITGEERLREHLDLVYLAWQQWEGRPTVYQVERVAVLERELGDVRRDFESLATQELAPLNDRLEQQQLAPIPLAAVGSEPRGVAGLPDATAVRCLVSKGRECGRAVLGAESQER
jgi:hypothetical protein